MQDHIVYQKKEMKKGVYQKKKKQDHIIATEIHDGKQSKTWPLGVCTYG